MKDSIRCLILITALMLTLRTIALAQNPPVEGTPVPTAPKPDWSDVQYLMGTWNCTDVSSRRPGPFQITTSFELDPTGYWLIKTEKIQKASWIPQEFTNVSRVTYDNNAKRWVRIMTGDNGAYAISTSPDRSVFTYQMQREAPDIASYAPEVYTKTSDTKRSMKTSFTEKSGRVVNVTETCTKAS
jgi:hypothetical protein